MFASDGLKTGGKFFAMVSQGDLVACTAYADEAPRFVGAGA